MISSGIYTKKVCQRPLRDKEGNMLMPSQTDYGNYNSRTGAIRLDYIHL